MQERFMSHTVKPSRPLQVKDIPKAELHVHLEASMTPALVRELADVYDITLPADLFTDEDRIEFNDFIDFLIKYDHASKVACCPGAMTRITYDYLRRLHAQGCIYAELTVSPDHLARANVSYTDTIQAVAKGIELAEQNFGMAARIIVVLVRHDNDQENGLEQARKDAVVRCERLVQEVINNPHEYVVGIGLAGNESAYPPHLFVNAFKMAQEAGLQLTAHAGEWTDAQDVENAITLLGVKRIGHGIHAVFDERVRELAKSRGIHFELCPDSNHCLETKHRYPETHRHLSHPIELFHQHGMRYSLSSDDPIFFKQLSDAYHFAQTSLDIPAKDLLHITLMGIEDSFAPPALKQDLLNKLHRFAEQHDICFPAHVQRLQHVMRS